MSERGTCILVSQIVSVGSRALFIAHSPLQTHTAPWRLLQLCRPHTQARTPYRRPDPPRSPARRQHAHTRPLKTEKTHRRPTERAYLPAECPATPTSHTINARARPDSRHPTNHRVIPHPALPSGARAQPACDTTWGSALHARRRRIITAPGSLSLSPSLLPMLMVSPPIHHIPSSSPLYPM